MAPRDASHRDSHERVDATQVEKKAESAESSPAREEVAEALEPPKRTESGKRVITENDCYEELGFCFPTWKKWATLTCIFLVQMSMNFNSSVITGAIPLLSTKYDVSEQYARIAQMIMLVFYAFGCVFSPFPGG
jgi:hypothetical protein